MKPSGQTVRPIRRAEFHEAHNGENASSRKSWGLVELVPPGSVRILLLGFFLLLASHGRALAAGSLPAKMGDFDGDRRATVLDLQRLVNHLNSTAPLSADLLLFADVNLDSVVNNSDVTTLANAILGRAPLPDPPDSDGDGLPDPYEILLGLNPNNPDTNGNTISDGDEDADGDGLKNRWEARYGYDPRTPSTHQISKPGGGFLLDAEEDPDLDGLDNLAEQANGTNPFNADTDSDGWADEVEVSDGKDPLNPASRPVFIVVAGPVVEIIVPGPDESGSSGTGTYLAQPAVEVSLPGQDESGQVGAGTTVAGPPVEVTLPGPDEMGIAGSGTTVAMPPVEVSLPGIDESGQAGVGTTLASPSVEIFLPGEDESGLSGAGTTLAFPPVEIFLPGVDEGGIPGLGTFLALPWLEIFLPGPDESGFTGDGTTLAQPLSMSRFRGQGGAAAGITKTQADGNENETTEL